MSANQEQDFVTVVTRTGVYHGRLLIGADGASGNIARSAGLNDNITAGLAWEAEIRVDTGSLKTFSQTVFLDWGSFPGGYGWVFPKGDHFSIGVGGPAKLSRWMMPYYQIFVEYLERKFGIHVLETMSIRSWPIPVRVKKSRFHNGRIIVAGDAAGLTDPLTGEGIYYAIRSGTLAAKCCHDFLAGLSDSMASYSEMVNEELMTELIEANRIKYLFNTVPGRIHRFVRDKDRAWRAFGKILRGERSYLDVKGGFGNWQVLWNGACSISKWISDYKETRFSHKGFNQ
jgi:flavin-dependent dehydrogenase